MKESSPGPWEAKVVYLLCDSDTVLLLLRCMLKDLRLSFARVAWCECVESRLNGVYHHQRLLVSTQLRYARSTAVSWIAPDDVSSREPPMREAIKAVDLDLFEEGRFTFGRARRFADTCLQEHAERNWIFDVRHHSWRPRLELDTRYII